jgi:uncharacterized protein DUF3592
MNLTDQSGDTTKEARRCCSSRKIAVFLIATAFFIFVPLRELLATCNRDFRFMRYGKAIRAYVQLLEPTNHQFVHYRYTVDTIEYHGVGRADFGNPSFEELAVGMELIANYLPSDPSDSCLGNPRDIFQDNLRSLLLIVLLFLVFTTALLVLPLKPQRTRENRQ